MQQKKIVNQRIKDASSICVNCLREGKVLLLFLHNVLEKKIGKPIDFQLVHHIEVDSSNPYGNSSSASLVIGLSGLPPEWIEVLGKDWLTRNIPGVTSVLQYVFHDRFGIKEDETFDLSDLDEKSIYSKKS